jgi:hypothetical protein
MPFPSFASTRVVALLAELVGFVIVEVEDERLNVFARGARCVSLSSALASDESQSRPKTYALLVSFQDMAKHPEQERGGDWQQDKPNARSGDAQKRMEARPKRWASDRAEARAGGTKEGGGGWWQCSAA